VRDLGLRGLPAALECARGIFVARSRRPVSVARRGARVRCRVRLWRRFQNWDRQGL